MLRALFDKLKCCLDDVEDILLNQPSSVYSVDVVKAALPKKTHKKR